jgi:hypothetical protein
VGVKSVHSPMRVKVVNVCFHDITTHHHHHLSGSPSARTRKESCCHPDLEEAR